MTVRVRRDQHTGTPQQTAWHMVGTPQMSLSPWKHCYDFKEVSGETGGHAHEAERDSPPNPTQGGQDISCQDAWGF